LIVSAVARTLRISCTFLEWSGIYPSIINAPREQEGVKLNLLDLKQTGMDLLIVHFGILAKLDIRSAGIDQVSELFEEMERTLSTVKQNLQKRLNMKKESSKNMPTQSSSSSM
jgi:hypothetical protein